MIDKATIIVTAGNGGAGAATFRRKKGKVFGPPTGGDGGNGGSVYLVPSGHIATLKDFRHRTLFTAQNGGVGGAEQKNGEAGNDLFVEVPEGTVVYNANTGEKIIDMAETAEPVLVARGGNGGRGNMHMRRVASHARGKIDWAVWQHAQSGEVGESYSLALELKTIADIGLIGLPNSGKSTLLSVLTAAKPKIADYPFTTLEPNLGVMYVGKKSYVIADIPGLIEGASIGKGLGKEFLRHIERTKVLVHLTQSCQDYMTVRKELEAHSKELLNKPEIVVISKMDVLTKDQVNEIQKQFMDNKITPLKISAITREGLNKLLHVLEELLK